MDSETTPDPLARAAKFEARKAAFVRAAAEVINRKGLRGMTFADVAAKLELVPTAVNYYFRRKEELASACFLEAIAHYNALLDRSDLQPAAADRLRCFLHDFAGHMADVASGRAEAVATFNDVRMIGDTAVDAAYADMFRRIRRLFSAEALGEPVRLQRNARTHLLVSQVLWAVLWLRQYEPIDYPRMIERMFDILVNGLAAPGRAWAPFELPPPPVPAEPLQVGLSQAGAAGVSREAFLRAATEMINEHGYAGASVSRISARLNVTKGAFYYHNQAKDDLVVQCFDRTLEVMRSSLMRSEAATSSGFDILASLAASMVRRGVSGETPLLRTNALSAVPEEMQAHLVRRFAQLSARLASVVSDGTADGSVRAVDANVAAEMIVAQINAGAELHHWAPGVDAALAVEVYARPLFMGLLAARPAAAPG